MFRRVGHVQQNFDMRSPKFLYFFGFVKFNCRIQFSGRSQMLWLQERWSFVPRLFIAIDIY